MSEATRRNSPPTDQSVGYSCCRLWKKNGLSFLGFCFFTFGQNVFDIFDRRCVPCVLKRSGRWQRVSHSVGFLFIISKRKQRNPRNVLGHPKLLWRGYGTREVPRGTSWVPAMWNVAELQRFCACGWFHGRNLQGSDCGLLV